MKSRLPVLAIAALAVTGGVATGGLRVTAPGNRHAAIRDAHALIKELTLPSAAQLLAREPSGDGGALKRPQTYPATPNLVDVHTWWRVPGPPSAAIAFIDAHPPAGGRLTMSGTFAGPNYAGKFDGWSWPVIRGVLETRSLLVTVAQLPDGSTGLRADAQDVWSVPRPAREQIPPGIQLVEVTRARTGQPPTVSIAVTDPVKVRKIVSLIDGLPITQPGLWSCPAFPADGPYVTFTFRASASGPALAQASQAAWASEPTTPCDPMSFSIRGHPETPLLGGAAVVRETGQLLGVQLATPLPAP